jgi:hypothetical protein
MPDIQFYETFFKFVDDNHGCSFKAKKHVVVTDTTNPKLKVVFAQGENIPKFVIFSTYFAPGVKNPDRLAERFQRIRENRHEFIAFIPVDELKTNQNG